MPRYIDADALNAAIEAWFDGVCVYDVSPSEAVNDFQSIVDEQPTVSSDEVRGVVRCSECKYAMHRTPVGIKTEILCDLFYSGMKKDDYCSYGKMMEVTSDE